MVVSTLSIGSNLFAEYAPTATEELAGGQYAQVSTATGDYQKLESATMKVDMNNTQSVSYTVSVYQNLTDASNPTSGELRYTSSRLTIDGTQESTTPTDLKVDLSSANIYLSTGETYAVVYTFDSVSDTIYYYTTNAAGTGYAYHAGWDEVLGMIETSLTTVGADSVSDNTAISAAKNTITIDNSGKPFTGLETNTSVYTEYRRAIYSE